uniref:Uncharacterized protein n=1 Tax=Setaria italica TaxID=4555 RepID=K3YMR4_SETIT
LTLPLFAVDICRSLASALKLLNRKKIKDDVDAILVNAEKAAACSFDFRGIVESNMCIPVLYFLPLDHKAIGDEATLLRPGTNTIKKPLDANDVCDLWRGIAWRKCSLEAKADLAGGLINRRRVLPAAVVEALLAGGRGRKRKNSSNPGGSSGTSLSGNQAAMRQQQMNLTEGQERDNLVSQLQECRGMEARKKNNGKAPLFQQPRTMDGRQQQQQQSLFVQSVLRTLDVPPYNPRIYADTAGLSDNAGACASNTDALPPALATPPVNPSPVPAPAPLPVYPAACNVFGATAPSAAVATMAAGGRPPLMLRPFSASHQGPRPLIEQQDMFALGTRGGAGMRRRETGTITLNFQQPPAGDLFTGMASGAVMTFGASAAATENAGAYGNAACSLLPSLNLGTDDHDELSTMVTMHNGSNSNPPVAPPPQHVGVASNEAAMEALYDNNYCYRSLMAPRLVDHRVAPANQVAAMGTLGSDGYIDYSTASAIAPMQADHGVAAGMEEEALNANNFSNYSSASPLAPDHQVLGTASNVNELTISGGAPLGDNASASFTASQNLVAAAPNGDQFAPGALDDDDLSGLAMGSHQGPGTEMDANAGFAAMSPADQYPANTIFSMEELLGPDDEQGGATDGAATDDAAGTSLIGGEGGNGTLDIGAADNLDDDFFLGDLWDFRPQPYDVNNGRK